MKLWQVEATVIISAGWLTWIIRDWVNHIMGGLRELAARIDAISEKADALQEKLDTLESDLDR